MSSEQQKSLEALARGFEVDQAINAQAKEFVIIRFGSKEGCKEIDKWLAEEAEAKKETAVIYTVESSSVPELVARYNLSGPTIMFFSNKTVVDRIASAIDKPEKEKFQEIVDKKNPPARGYRRRRGNYYRMKYY